MQTALAEWTTERPDAPGHYWWRWYRDERPQVVQLSVDDEHGWWYACGNDTAMDDSDTQVGNWAHGFAVVACAD